MKSSVNTLRTKAEKPVEMQENSAETRASGRVGLVGMGAGPPVKVITAYAQPSR